MPHTKAGNGRWVGGSPGPQLVCVGWGGGYGKLQRHYWLVFCLRLLRLRTERPAAFLDVVTYCILFNTLFWPMRSGRCEKGVAYLRSFSSVIPWILTVLSFFFLYNVHT